MPRQMPTPPGSGDFGSMLHSFATPEDEGYDTDKSYPPLFSSEQRKSQRKPLVGDPRMPSLEELIKYHIYSRDNRPFHDRHISPPSLTDYRTMTHFIQRTEPYRRQSQEYADAYTGQKRKATSDYASSSYSMSRENSQSSMDAMDTEYAPIQSRKRQVSAPIRRQLESERPERRGHARTSSKSSNKAAPLTKNARAQKSKAQKSDRYEDYPDFAPEPQTMKDAMQEAKNVKDWHGSSINVYEDADRDKLSEAELEVAQRLHLPCAKYLCVKRQIFEELVRWLREEQDKKTPNWNKTTAQGAVNCDVTKASELFMFYNRVGWFNKDLFKKWVDMPQGTLNYSTSSTSATAAA